MIFKPALALAFLVCAMSSGSGESRPVVQPQPAGVADPGLWLDAEGIVGLDDGEPVGMWHDASGKGRHAIFEARVPQANREVGLHQPPVLRRGALAGRQAVAFDAHQRHTLLLNREGGMLGQGVAGFTAAFVVRPSLRYGAAPFPNAAWMPDRYLFLSHVSNYNSRVSVQIVENTGEVKLFSRPVPAQPKVTKNSSFSGGERIAVRDGEWTRLLVTVDYGAKLARIVIDGKILERALPPESADRFEDVPSPVTGIGSTTLGDWLTFDLAEMVCYDRSLTGTELKQLDDYFCEKYRLASDP